MPQATDIVLGGDGYMIQPGTYRRSSDGSAESITGSIVLRDFVGGQRRAIQLEPERGWDSEGVGPALFGQGVEPWPYQASHADAVIAVPSSTSRIPSALLADAIYIGIGRYLYRAVAISSPTWSDFTQIADLGSGVTITGLAPFAGKLAIACGSARDITLIDPVSLALTTLQTGEKAYQIIAYATRLAWSDATPGNAARIRLTTGGGLDDRQLDSDIVRMVLHGGKIAIATRSSLYLLGGRSDPANGVWLGEVEPAFTQGMWTGPNDFQTLVSFGGKLYAWLANQLMEWNPNSGASRQGWRSTGIEGRESFDATVAGNWLIVSIRALNGSGQLWAYDGTGWWLMESGIVRAWPISLAGTARSDLLAFRHGSTTYDIYRLSPRDATNNALRSSGAWRTSLLDAGRPESPKIWRSVQATFATPEQRGNPVSTDPVTVEIRYSIDGGATWTSHVSMTISGPPMQSLTLGGPIASPPSSAYLQVEVRWSSVVDWTPTLTGIAIIWDRTDAAARRRRWQMTVQARDRSIERNGGLHPRTAPAITADLWTAWSVGSVLPMRDVDYDQDPVERNVRLIGISEARPSASPGLPPDVATLALTLIEI